MDVKTIGEMNFLVNDSNLEKFLYNLKSSSEDRFDDILTQVGMLFFENKLLILE